MQQLSHQIAQTNDTLCVQWVMELNGIFFYFQWAKEKESYSQLSNIPLWQSNFVLAFSFELFEWKNQQKTKKNTHIHTHKYEGTEPKPILKSDSKSHLDPLVAGGQIVIGFFNHTHEFSQCVHIHPGYKKSVKCYFLNWNRVAWRLWNFILIDAGVSK